jgi:hypothetical protein
VGEKAIQQMLRHISIAVTTDIYIQEMAENIEAVIETVNHELTQPHWIAAG